jgi:hypothetical protein
MFDLKQLCTIMKELDIALTKCTYRKAECMLANQSHTLRKVLEWDKIEYYLSDGGYSRIWLDPFEEKVFLSGNSTAAAKMAWNKHEVQSLVNELIVTFREGKK